MTPALPVDEARKQILDAVPPLQPIDLPLAEAYGCVAASDVATDYDIPPFSAAEVDGFAARSADIVTASPTAPVGLRMAGWVRLGQPPDATVGWGEAVRVVAGAPIPAGADCVIPLTSATAEGETVRVSRSAEPNAHINPAGEDVRAGSVLVPAGRRLAAAEMGILATAGYGSVPAYPKLRVGVLSIGELIEPGRSAGFGEVRDATSYLLLGALRDVGAVPYRIGIVVDPRAHLRETVMSNALRADAFIAAGGQLEDGETSVPAVLSGLGDVRTVHVAAHPVSALGFGTVEGKPFFCVSGKPMSALVSFEILVRQAILKMMGRRDLRRPEVSAVLDEPVSGPRDVALFVPARMTHDEGGWHARPTGPVAEGLLGAAVEANALVALPAGERPIPGSQVRVQVVRPLER